MDKVTSTLEKHVFSQTFLLEMARTKPLLYGVILVQNLGLVLQALWTCGNQSDRIGPMSETVFGTAPRACQTRQPFVFHKAVPTSNFPSYYAPQTSLEVKSTALQTQCLSAVLRPRSRAQSCHHPFVLPLLCKVPWRFTSAIKDVPL